MVSFLCSCTKARKDSTGDDSEGTLVISHPRSSSQQLNTLQDLGVTLYLILYIEIIYIEMYYIGLNLS